MTVADDKLFDTFLDFRVKIHLKHQPADDSH